MTPQQALAALRKDNPGKRLAVSRSGHALGAWSDKLGRFQVVAFADVQSHGDWVPMSTEVLIDGKPPVPPEDWME